MAYCLLLTKLLKTNYFPASYKAVGYSLNYENKEYELQSSTCAPPPPPPPAGSGSR